MIGRGARLIGLLVLAALWSGCASTHEGAIDPALFARAPVASESRLAGRVALLVPPQVRSTVHDPMRDIRVNVRLPVGRIVEQAALAALGDALDGGVQPVEAVPPPGSGLDATLVVDAVRAECRRRTLWLIPMPPPLFVLADQEVVTRLAFDLRLVDGQGHTVWTRTYDSGTEAVKRASFWSPEATPEVLVRMAHEAAWRLSQQAVSDLRDWLVVERSKPREL